VFVWLGSSLLVIDFVYNAKRLVRFWWLAAYGKICWRYFTQLGLTLSMIEFV
jgi:hypothetical protein